MLPPPVPVAAPARLQVLAQAGAERMGTAPLRLLALGPDGRAFTLRVRLRAGPHGLAPDMAQGYQLFCGRWTPMLGGGVRVDEALVESFRYPALAADRTPSSHRLSPIGRGAFDDAGVRYAPLLALAFDDAAQSRIRFTCAQTPTAR